MLTLIVIRHAKSSWDDPSCPDHDRPLNARGRAAAPAVGQWLAAKGYRPDLVLVSDAARTRQTAALIMPCLVPAPAVVFRPDLYHASDAALIGALRSGRGACCAIIGHNPGIGALAATLLNHPPDHPRFADYPTCATTVIDLPAAHWADITPGTGHCRDFIIPNDLPFFRA